MISDEFRRDTHYALRITHNVISQVEGSAVAAVQVLVAAEPEQVPAAAVRSEEVPALWGCRPSVPSAMFS